MSFVEKKGDQLILKCHFFERGLAKRVPHYKWQPKRKVWAYPFGSQTISEIEKHFPDVQGLKELKKELEPSGLSYEDNRKTPLFEHQKASVNYALRHPRCAILSDIGTGKTAVAVSYLEKLFEVGLVEGALIVCPLSVIGVWESEIEKFSDLKAVVFDEKSTTKRLEKLIANLDRKFIYICNYEFVRNALQVFQELPLDIMILDESVKIKNHAAKVSKAIHQLAIGVKYRMLLTAILTPKNPLEGFSQMKFIDPSLFGNSWNAFRYRYALYGGYQGYEMVGYQNLDEYKKLLFSSAIRFKQIECYDLPSRIYEKRVIPFPDKNLGIYEQMKKQMIAECEDQKITAQNVLVKIGKLQQICSGFVTDADGKVIDLKKNPKLDALFEFLEEVPEEEKVVVFFHYIHSIRKIQEEAEKRGWKCVAIWGAVSIEDRTEGIRAFQKDPKVKLFLGQIRTGGIGITLTAGRICIFYENEYSWGIRSQAEGRLHRIGQTRSVSYIDLVMKNSIDGQILRILQDEEDIVSFIQKQGGVRFLQGL